MADSADERSSGWVRRRVDPASPVLTIALLALAGLLVSLHVALLAGPLWDRDERPHAGYAVSLLLGELPTIDTEVLDDPDRFPTISESLAPQDEAHRDIWTANHPPLYYLVSLPFMAVADALGMPDAGLLAMRIINAIGTAVGLFLVGLIARELVPRRQVIWVLSTLVALSCATVTHLGGLIFNDGLGVAASSITILLGLRILIHGPNRVRLIGAALAASAAAATRAPGVLAVAFCCAAVLLAALHDASPDRWRRAIGGAVVVGLVPAVTVGWFYVRNISLYGDVGATAALLEKFGRRARGSLLGIATEPTFYLTQLKGLWIRQLLDPRFPVVLVLLGVLTVAGLAIALVVALVRAHSRVPGHGPRAWVASPIVHGWVLLGCLAVTIEGSAIGFYSTGGSPHARYLFPVLPLIALVVAIGLMGLLAWVPPVWSGRRDEIGLGVFGMLLLTMAVLIQLSSTEQIASRGGPPSLGGALPAFALLLAIAVAVAAVTLGVRQIATAATAPGPGQPRSGARSVHESERR